MIGANYRMCRAQWGLLFQKHEKTVLLKVLKHVHTLSLQPLSSLVMVFVYYLT